MTALPPWSTLNRCPAWFEEISSCLASSSQFVLTGNVHDRLLIPGATNLRSVKSLPHALVNLFEQAGYDFVLNWNIVDGLSFSSIGERAQPEEIAEQLDLGSGAFDKATPLEPDIEHLASLLGPCATSESQGVLIIDYASRILAGQEEASLQEQLRSLFRVAEKLSRETQPRRERPYNPIVWICDSERDLPSWFLQENDGVRVVTIPKPDRQERSLAAYKYYLAGLDGTESDTQRAACSELFALQTHDLTLRSMEDIWRLARHNDIPAQSIDQAARSYRIGVSRSPWAEPSLRDRIGQAEALITDEATSFGSKVFGQQHAVEKAVDILMRSSLGLSSAHAQGNVNRPRGVLFLAGPTGVGKTQLAKAINTVVFDADEPLRFDMSEFSSEHAQARLLGAPPGYVGFGAGGELTNGIRQNPFSVVLFDEIEKAHPSIFDKFLQLLDEGRLTDGSGQTVFFSEAIIVFTSNLGMFEYVTKKTGANTSESVRQPVERREGSEGYLEFVEKVTAGIVKCFQDDIERPELLNRIGHDNIIVFDFIDRPGAQRIFNNIEANIKSRVAKEMNLDLQVKERAAEALFQFAWTRCNDDRMGGRGIGSAVETALVNPLARLIYDQSPPPGSTLTIESAHCGPGGRWTLTGSYT